MAQRGKFYTGTFGYPILLNTGVDLSDTIAISLEVSRPKKVSVYTLDISPDEIVDVPKGIIRYTVRDGDLTVPGTYVLRLSITKTGNRRLTAESAMEVG